MLLSPLCSLFLFPMFLAYETVDLFVNLFRYHRICRSECTMAPSRRPVIPFFLLGGLQTPDRIEFGMDFRGILHFFYPILVTRVSDSSTSAVYGEISKSRDYGAFQLPPRIAKLTLCFVNVHLVQKSPICTYRNRPLFPLLTLPFPSNYIESPPPP